MEDLGFHLHSTDYDIEFPKSSPPEYTHTLGIGIVWSSNLPFTMPILFPDDTTWYLKIKRGATIWTSPPLVIQPIAGQQGKTRAGRLGGSDRTIYLLSRLATDKPTYSKTTADAIIDDLAGDVGVTVSGDVPIYNIYEYDAHEGSIISHISSLLRKGGKTFYIGTTGDLVVVSMDVASSNAYGTAWVTDCAWEYDPTAKKTRVQFIKASKLRNAYDYRWTTTGSLKSGTFDAAMRGVQVIDSSIIGYTDQVGLYDANGLQMGPVILFHPDDYTGATFSPSQSSAPVISFNLTVFPPKDNPTATSVDARARFIGVLDDELAGYDISFSTAETPDPLFSYYVKQNCRIHYLYGLDISTCDYSAISNNFGTWYYRNGVFYEGTNDILNSFRHTSITSFENIGSPSTVPIAEADRPADTTNYEDCSIMPTIEHCAAVKKLITYEDVKKQYKTTFTGPKVLFELLPGTKIEYDRQPDSIINSIAVSQKGIKAICYPELWW